MIIEHCRCDDCNTERIHRLEELQGYALCLESALRTADLLQADGKHKMARSLLAEAMRVARERDLCGEVCAEAEHREARAVAALRAANRLN